MPADLKESTYPIENEGKTSSGLAEGFCTDILLQPADEQPHFLNRQPPH